MFWFEEARLVELRRLGLHGVCSFHDSLLEHRDALQASLGLPRSTRLEHAWDKAVQRDAVAAAGLETVGHHRVSSPSDLLDAVRRVGLPGVLKPRRASASEGLTFLRNETQVHFELAARSSWDQLLFEALIPGERAAATPDRLGLADYVSVESAVSNGHVAHVAIVDKLHLARVSTDDERRFITRETGDLFPSRLPSAVLDQVEVVTTKTLRGLGVERGVMHTELRTCPDATASLIEVNGRLGGEINRLVAGSDLVRVELDLSVGLDPGELKVGKERWAACVYVPCYHAERLVRGNGSRRTFADSPGVVTVDAAAPAGVRPADVGYVLAKALMTGRSLRELDEAVGHFLRRAADVYPHDINADWLERCGPKVSA